jgi:hypothetical protein
MAGNSGYPPKYYEDLLPYANTEQQREIIAALAVGRTLNEVADKLQVVRQSVQSNINNVKRRAVRQGWSPEHDMTHPVPDGFQLKGQSVLYDQDGQIRARWVKSATDQDRRAEMIVEAIDRGGANWPKYRPKKPPKDTDEELCAVFVLTDYHVGALCWSQETGEDWDVDIAREVFLNAVNDVIAAAPSCKHAVFAQLGDFLHFDSLYPVTSNPSTSHILDADTRFARVVDVAIELNRAAIELMLTKFETIRVIQAEGNHDEASSVWMRKLMKHIYEKEDRVSIDDSDFPYYAHQFGKNMLAFHHGHKAKVANLPKIFASEPRYREMWGLSDYTYIHTGHYHHEKVWEDAGAKVSQHPTLASRDAYAARLGLTAKAGAKLTVYHQELGELYDYYVRPEFHRRIAKSLEAHAEKEKLTPAQAELYLKCKAREV